MASAVAIFNLMSSGGGFDSGPKREVFCMFHFLQIWDWISGAVWIELGSFCPGCSG